MTIVLHHRPQVRPVAGVRVRTYRGAEDIDTWLQLRRATFADEVPRARPWSRQDFRAELLAKWWWEPQAFWLAETTECGRTVGSVMLAHRGSAGSTSPVAHWLAVAPQWRRRGIGRLLLQTLQTYCWAKGWREIGVETHAGWQSAMATYRTLGWKVAEPPISTAPASD
jgi:GNAT superfamily N-acetyltransferase